MEYTKDTRIIDLTLGQFEEWMMSKGFQPKQVAAGATGKNWVYGTAGVMALFGWSHSRALHSVHSVIKPAVVWTGPRKFQVDADFAMELVRQHNINNQK